LPSSLGLENAASSSLSNKAPRSSLAALASGGNSSGFSNSSTAAGDFGNSPVLLVGSLAGNLSVLATGSSASVSAGMSGLVAGFAANLVKSGSPPSSAMTLSTSAPFLAASARTLASRALAASISPRLAANSVARMCP